MTRAGKEVRTGIAALAAIGALLCAATSARATDRVYWASNLNPGAIRVGNLDGSGTASSAFPGENKPFGVAINPATGKIYWGQSVNPGAIRVANLDGTGAHNLFSNEAAPEAPAIDPVAGKIYWGDNAGGKIRVANLDGSGTPADLFPATAPVSVAIDPAGGTIYWSDNGTNSVRCGNLNGTGTPQVLFSSEATHGVAVDHAAGKIYSAGFSSVRVGNLACSPGGTMSDLIPNSGQNYGIALDPGAGRIYWGNLTPGAIRVGALGGSATGSDVFGSESVPILPALLRAPAGLGAPQIAGASTPGSVLSCSQASWASDEVGAFLYRAPQSLGFQWSLGGADIAGATAGTFTAFVAGDYRCRATATNAAGTSAQSSAAHTVGTPSNATKATVSSLRETNSVFAVGASSTPTTGKTAARRHKKGTVFSFRLDQAAIISIAIQTTARGRRVGRTCKPDSPRLRHKPRCTRTIKAGTLSRSGHAGLNKVAFTGRIGRRALKPSRYQAVFTAIDAAGASRSRSISFRIVKR